MSTSLGPLLLSGLVNTAIASFLQLLHTKLSGYEHLNRLSLEKIIKNNNLLYEKLENEKCNLKKDCAVMDESVADDSISNLLTKYAFDEIISSQSSLSDDDNMSDNENSGILTLNEFLKKTNISTRKTVQIKV